MSIQIPNIPNDDILSLASKLDGCTSRPAPPTTMAGIVSGHFQSAKAMADGRIGIKLTRYMNGKHVLDSVADSSGNDPLGRPWRTAFHVRTGSDLLAALDAAA